MQGNAGFFFLIRDLGEILGIHPHDQNVHHLHIERVYIFNLDLYTCGWKKVAIWQIWILGDVSYN